MQVQNFFNHISMKKGQIRYGIIEINLMWIHFTKKAKFCFFSFKRGQGHINFQNTIRPNWGRVTRGKFQWIHVTKTQKFLFISKLCIISFKSNQNAMQRENIIVIQSFETRILMIMGSKCEISLKPSCFVLLTDSFSGSFQQKVNQDHKDIKRGSHLIFKTENFIAS